MAAFGDGCKALEWAVMLHLALFSTSIVKDVLDRAKVPDHVWHAAARQVCVQKRRG